MLGLKKNHIIRNLKSLFDILWLFKVLNLKLKFMMFLF